MQARPWHPAGPGGEAYLTKPFDATELRATLANLLAQRRILQEKFAKQIRLDAPAKEVVSLDDQFLQKVLARASRRTSTTRPTGWKTSPAPWP